MKAIIILSSLFFFVNVYACDKCPNEQAFCDSGWVIHRGEEFEQILQNKLSEFTPEIGKDLVLDSAESYLSDFSHDMYLLMWIIVLDRLSTQKDEMWGDVSFATTGPHTQEFTEIRWYDPITKTKHIVCNPEYAFCLTTKIPLAYNTIF